MDMDYMFVLRAFLRARIEKLADRGITLNPLKIL